MRFKKGLRRLTSLGNTLKYMLKHPSSFYDYDNTSDFCP